MKNLILLLAACLLLVSGQTFGQAITNASVVQKDSGPLHEDDSVSDQIGLPGDFDFKFFNQTKTHFKVNTNGVLFFGASDTNYRPLSETLKPDSLAVLWDDWKSYYTPTNGRDDLVFYKVVGTKPLRKAIIQWNNYGIFSSTQQFGTMQVILYENTYRIQYNYISLLTPGRSDGGAGLVAIKSLAGTEIVFSKAQPVIMQGTSICWVPQGGGSTYSHTVLNTPNADCPQPSAPLTNQAAPPPDKPDGLMRAAAVFSWNAAANADSYRFILSTDSKLNNPIKHVSGIAATSYNSGLTFRPGTTYYWAVQAYNPQGTTFSDTQRFMIPLTAPTTVGDSYSVSQDGILMAGASRNILDNDHDPQNDPLTAIEVSGPAHADSFTLNADGTFDYDPVDTFSGADSFMYKVRAGGEDGNPVSVVIGVTDANFAPTAQDDAYSVAEDGTLTVNAPGLLANDGDIDVHDHLTAIKVTDPASGSLTVNADGGLTYSPNADFNGSDSATYKANDGHLDSPAVTIRFTVNAVNDAPVSSVDSYSVPEDGHLDVLAVNGVLANDHDAEGDHLSAVLDSGPSNGTLTFNTDGSFNYVPTPLFFGSDSFSYHANDGSLDGAVTTVSITVNHVNHPPVGNPDSYSVEEDGVLTVLVAGGVLDNDTDRDKQDHLNARKLTTAGNGLLHLNADGSFYYRPSPNYNGPDSFTYEVWDGIAASHPVTVNITVRPVNDPVSVHFDIYHVPEDGFLNIAAPSDGILANDIDPDGDTLTALLKSGPLPFHGQLHLRKDGTFTYRPDPDFNGTDGFFYSVYDGNASRVLSFLEEVIIYVNPVNDAPVAHDDSYSIFEDGILAVHASESLLRNDLDKDLDTLSVVNLTAAANGSVTLGTQGRFIYRPNLTFNGLDSFTYQVSDGSLTSNTATVVVNVRAKNDEPIAVDDAYSVGEDGLLTVIEANGLLANDKDVDADTLVVIVDSTPSSGTLQMELNGGFTYRPDANFNGSDSFSYFASDATMNSAAPATVTITVNAVNDPPLAGSNGYAIAEDGFLRVPVSQGILGNDIDPDGDSLLALLDVGTTHGALQFSLDGSFTYKPDAGFNGVDGFTYHANDGSLDSPTVSVGIAVNPVNDQPLAGSDSYSVSEDGVLDIAESTGLLNNDIDLDGDTLSVVMKSTTVHGHLIVTPGGAINYRPDVNFNGSDSFTYADFDGSVESDIVTVTITVNPENDLPAAADDSYSVGEDGILNVTAANGLLANDFDQDGDTLIAVLQSSVSNGVLQISLDGSLSYTPNADFNGLDSFTYVANDGAGDSNVATVLIRVNAVNDAPLAGNDVYSVAEDTLLSVPAASGVLANDIDFDGDQLLVILQSTVSNGALQMNLDGQFSYMPNPGFNGQDSFTYLANDGSANSAVVTVTINVNPVNDAPLAGADAYTIAEDGVLNVGAAAGVLGNDLDFDGDLLIALLKTPTVNGALHLNLDGSFIYQPDPSFNGTDSFSYAAGDGALESGVVSATISISPENDPPLGVSDSYSLPQDGSLNVTAANGVLANDSDIDGNRLLALIETYPANGALGLNLDGSFGYTPAAGFSGADSFTYRANDGSVSSSPVVVNITVNAVNTPPFAGADGYSTLQDSSLAVDAASGVVANDIDADGDQLTAVLQTLPTHGNLHFNPDGSFTYTPDPGYSGLDSFTYLVHDSDAYSNVAAVTIDVRLDNEPPVAVPDEYQVIFGQALKVPAPGVMGNDSDPDGDVLRATLVTSPANGVVHLNLDGSFTYTPQAGHIGSDGFMYEIHDGHGGTAMAEVRLLVAVVETKPVPALNQWMLLLMTALFVLVAALRIRYFTNQE